MLRLSGSKLEPPKDWKDWKSKGSRIYMLRSRKNSRNHVRRDLTRERREMEKQADALVREIVYKRDGYRCVKCGTDKSLTPSHIRPRGKCPRMTWMAINILTMCSACHLHWWHKDPIAAIDWLNAQYPGLYEQLLMIERQAPKVDMKELLVSLSLELRG